MPRTKVKVRTGDPRPQESIAMLPESEQAPYKAERRELLATFGQALVRPRQRLDLLESLAALAIDARNDGKHHGALSLLTAMCDIEYALLGDCEASAALGVGLGYPPEELLDEDEQRAARKGET